MVEYMYTNEYVIEGEYNALKGFASAIAKVEASCHADESKLFIKELFSEVGLMEGCRKLLFNNKGIDWRAKWEVENIFTKESADGYKANLMKIKETSKNNTLSGITYLVRNISGLCSSPCYFRTCAYDSHCKTNSREIFPEMYHVYCPTLIGKGYDNMYFMDDDALLSTFKKKFDIPAKIMDLSALMNWCDENDILCYINEIDEVHPDDNPDYHYGLDGRRMAIDAHKDDMEKSVRDLFIKIHNEVDCCVSIGRGVIFKPNMRCWEPAVLFKEPIDKALLSRYILDFGCSEVKDKYFLGYDNNTETVLSNKSGKELFLEYLITQNDKTLRQSADKGYKYAIIEQSHKFLYEEDSLNWLVKAAEVGDAESQYKLAIMYFDEGNILPEDIKEVYSFLSNSAKSGYKSALEILSSSKVSELRLTDDQKRYWIEMAAEAGIVDAIESLAELYFNAGGYSHALELFKKAEHTIDPKCSVPYTNETLAIMYYEGKGCDIDYMKSAYYFDKGVAEYQLALTKDHANVDPAIWKSFADRFYCDREILSASLNNDEDRIIELYEKYGDCDTDYYNDVALAYCKKENYVKALPLAHQSVATAPDDANSHDTLAKVMEGLGKYEEALSAYEKSMDLFKKECDEDGVNTTDQKIAALRNKM